MKLSLLSSLAEVLIPVGDAAGFGFEEGGGVTVDRDAFDLVVFADAVDDVLAFCGFAKDGVHAVEVWRWAVGDEEL